MLELEEILMAIISIHASLAGGDVTRDLHKAEYVTISIHASLAGGDPRPGAVAGPRAEFQSTPPSREATRHLMHPQRRRNISIHASLAGGDDRLDKPYGQRHISIHASLAGGDSVLLPKVAGEDAFQSTPPSREATWRGPRDCAAAPISIHAFLAGGDDFPIHTGRLTTYFNPRLPRGRRPGGGHPGDPQQDFNPRLPRGRRRALQKCDQQLLLISIHASLAGGDLERGL